MAAVEVYDDYMKEMSGRRKFLKILVQEIKEKRKGSVERRIVRAV